MGGAVPGVRRLEHRSGAAGAGPCRRGKDLWQGGGPGGSGCPPGLPGNGPADRGGDPLSHGNGGTGPGAGRRRCEGLAGAGGRRPRHRQVHADAADLQQALRDVQGTVCIRGGIRASAEIACETITCREQRPLCDLRDLSGGSHGVCGGRAAGHFDRGFHPDALQRRSGFSRGQHQPGEGLHHGADAAGQGAGDHGVRHRPRQQRGFHRRSQGVGAYGGLCFVLRGGPAHHIPHPAGGQEPLWRYQ